MGSGSSDDVTQTNIAAPWAAQSPFLQDIFKLAQQRFQDPTSQLAPQSEATLAGQQQNIDYASGALQDYIGSVFGAQDFLLSGDVLKAEANPYLQDYISSAIDPVFQRLERGTLPGVESQFLLAGQPGGSRQGITEGLAISDASRQALGTTADISSRAYGQGLGAYERAIAMAPQMATMGLLPGEVQQNIGRQQEAYQQALLSEGDVRLQNYLNLISGNFGGERAATSPGAQSVGWAQGALGGAATGYSTTGDWWGALAGAVLGGISGSQ